MKAKSKRLLIGPRDRGVVEPDSTVVIVGTDRLTAGEAAGKEDVEEMTEVAMEVVTAVVYP